MAKCDMLARVGLVLSVFPRVITTWTAIVFICQLRLDEPIAEGDDHPLIRVASSTTARKARTRGTKWLSR